MTDQFDSNRRGEPDMNNQRIMRLRTMDYNEYLKTPEWNEKRENALERDEYRCRLCNTDERLEVHHRTYTRRGCEDLNDLTTLCDSCHEHFHRKQSQIDLMVRTYNAPRELDTGKHSKIRWEEYLLGLLIEYPSLFPFIRGIINDGDLLGTDTRELYHLLDDAQLQQGSDAWDRALEQLVPPELMETVTKAKKCKSNAFLGERAAMDLKSFSPKDEAFFAKEAIVCATRLRRESLSRLTTDLTHQIDAAVRAGDNITVRQLSQQLSATQREMRTIYAAMHLQK